MKYLSLFSILILAGCQPKATGMVDVASTYDAYGEAITAEGAVPAIALMADVPDYLGQEIKVESEIVEVCQRKGCWLTLDTGTGQQPIRINVPRTEAGDYVYTVPKDISRQRAIVAGTLVEQELSEEERAHYAEDAGDPSAMPPPVLLQITASGILIEKSSTAS